MNEPRPAMISARPRDRRSSVANCWNTRTGSSELITDTALVSRIRLVRSAAAARTTAGRGDREVRPVVLADAEHVQPDLVGEHDLLDELPDPRPGVGPARERVRDQLAEGVEAELHQPQDSGARFRTLSRPAACRAGGPPGASSARRGPPGWCRGGRLGSPRTP